MKRLITLSLLALVAAPTLADPVTKTVTYDGPKGSGTKTTIVDREAGTRSLEGTATRNSDGATATRSRQSERTADGRSGSGSATRFNGNQRSYEYERVNSGNGFNTTGTATGANGAVYEYRAHGRRGENRAGRQRELTRNGKPVYRRKDTVRKTKHGTTRTTKVRRAKRNPRPGK